MGALSVLVLIGALVSIYLLNVVFIVISMFYVLVNYLFESIFLYKISKNNGYKYPITSWIMFYNKLIMGKFSNKKKESIALFIVSIIILILFVLSLFISDYVVYLYFFIFILLIIKYVLDILIYHGVYEKLSSNAVLFTIINIFTLGFFKSIIAFLLVISKNWFFLLIVI